MTLTPCRAAQSCGTVQKVTIPGDAMKHPKGYAYVEFSELEAVEHAEKLAGTVVGGRAITIAPKRTNIAGFNGRGRGRGRGRGGRGGAVPFFQPMMVPMPMGAYFNPFPGRGGRGGRGRGARGGRRGGYTPY